MLPRQSIIDKLTLALSSVKNVLIWDNVPSEYSTEAIYLKDTREKYEKQGNGYVCTLSIEIIAIAIETASSSADKLGNLILEDLIKAISQVSMPGVFFYLEDSHKWVETKGKTACEIELNLSVKYKI